MTIPTCPAKAALLLLPLAALIHAAPAHAIGDGPRAYVLVPEKATVGSLYGIFIDGNSSLDPATAAPDSELSIDVVALQLTQSFTLGGLQNGLFVVLPVGQTAGRTTIERPFLPPIELSGKSSGLADIQFAGVFGIAGSPALALKDYVAYKPGFALGALARVTAPTGDYSGSRAVNLGANRWAFQLGAPMGFVVGQSFLDPKLMTFELVPSVTFFTANDDPFGADRVTQAPLYRLEAHATRNVGRALWLSLDMIGTAGGRTRTDDISDDNAKSSLELGGTVGVNLSKSFSLKATYGGLVARGDNGLQGDGFRLVATKLF